MATKNQEKVLDIVAKDVIKGNKVSISKAMRESGVYSEDFSRQPTRLTQSKGWKELVEKRLPDSLLSKVHAEGLKATTYVSEGVGRGETVLKEVPDFNARHKYLKTAYELKGRTVVKDDFAPQTINYNLFYQPNFQDALRTAEQQMKAVIIDAKPTEETV